MTERVVGEKLDYSLNNCKRSKTKKTNHRIITLDGQSYDPHVLHLGGHSKGFVSNITGDVQTTRRGA